RRRPLTSGHTTTVKDSKSTSRLRTIEHEPLTERRRHAALPRSGAQGVTPANMRHLRLIIFGLAIVVLSERAGGGQESAPAAAPMLAYKLMDWPAQAT